MLTDPGGGVHPGFDVQCHHVGSSFAPHLTDRPRKPGGLHPAVRGDTHRTKRIGPTFSRSKLCCEVQAPTYRFLKIAPTIQTWSEMHA
jgi:hypothetical protein